MTRLRDHIAALLADGHANVQPGIDPGQAPAERCTSHLPSAVLMAITDRPEPGLILTQRAAALRRHAGQVALPGGRLDPTDADAVAGALREADEEIGLPSDLVDVIALTDAYRTHSGFAIMPVVAVIPPDLPLVPRAGEVDAVFEVPLAFLLDPDSRTEHHVMFEGRPRKYFEILWQDRRIWGVTAAMLVNLSLRLDRNAILKLGRAAR